MTQFDSHRSSIFFICYTLKSFLFLPAEDGPRRRDKFVLAVPLSLLSSHISRLPDPRFLFGASFR